MKPRGVLLILCLACSAFGCRKQDQTGAASAAMPVSTAMLISSDWAADTGLSLRAFALVDTVRSADAAGVVVLLHNGGTPVAIRNHPSYYSLQVRDPEGRELTPGASYYEAPLLGSKADLVLPRNGVLGQVLSLSCAVPPFDSIKATDRCMWRFPITKTGTYLITARYRVPHVSIGGEPAPTGTDLRSNTVRLYVQQP